MSRTVYIIRHGKSEGTRHTEANFGPLGSSLNEQGVQESRKLQMLLEELGINVNIEPAATSQKKRAYETAEAAGFKNIKKYQCLNEVARTDSPEVIDAMIAKKEASPVAIAAAQELLKNPPPERIWVTHGQLIAGIAKVLDIPSSELFIPELSSITRLLLP